MEAHLKKNAKMEGHGLSDEEVAWKMRMVMEGWGRGN
jgi:hypothetical protein